MEPWEYEEDRQVQAAKWESHFPKCEECGERIVEGEDYPYPEIVDGWYHWECFENKFKKTMPDWREINDI